MNMYTFYLALSPLVVYALFVALTNANPSSAMKLLSHLIQWRKKLRAKSIERFVRENTDQYYKSLEGDWLKQGWTIEELKEASKHTRKETEAIFRELYDKLHNDKKYRNIEEFFNL